jgi:hypothetical protein
MKNLCFALAALALMAPAAVPTRVTTAQLGGADRYLTAISTDKPIYRAGDKVYVRGVLFKANGHTPLIGTNRATVEIKGPKGETITTANTQIIDSVWGFAWDVTDTQAGGEYTIHVTYPYLGHPPADRKFDVRAYRAPRLKTQIVFVRDGTSLTSARAAATARPRAPCSRCAPSSPTTKRAPARRAPAASASTSTERPSARPRSSTRTLKARSSCPTSASCSARASTNCS